MYKCKMDLIVIAFLWIYISSTITTGSGRPTGRSLQDSQSNLPWEAWLLVNSQPTDFDDDDSSAVVRRITPKSIFTVRPFSPELLPPCAEGYQSDSMGRCVKFVKIDQSAHLDYLIKRLNTMYTLGDGDEDYEDSEEKDTIRGPFQVNIPFGADTSSSQNDSNTKFAIIVTPSTNNFEVNDSNATKNETLFLNVPELYNASGLNESFSNKDDSESTDQNTTYVLVDREVNDEPVIVNSSSSNLTFHVIDVLISSVETQNVTDLKHSEIGKHETTTINNQIHNLDLNISDSVPISDAFDQIYDTSNASDIIDFNDLIRVNRTVVDERNSSNLNNNELITNGSSTVDNSTVINNNESVNQTLYNNTQISETIQNVTTVTETIIEDSGLIKKNDIPSLQHAIRDDIINTTDDHVNKTVQQFNDTDFSPVDVKTENLEVSNSTVNGFIQFPSRMSIYRDRPRTNSSNGTGDSKPTEPERYSNPNGTNFNNSNKNVSQVLEDRQIRFPEYNHRNRDKHMYKLWNTESSNRNNNSPSRPLLENAELTPVRRFGSRIGVNNQKESFYREILPEDWIKIFGSRKSNT